MKYLIAVSTYLFEAASILLMSAFFATVLALTGCSQIDATRIQNAIDKTEKVTETVCTAAELFQAAGVPQPVLDACARAMTTLERDEYVLVSQAVDCVVNETDPQARAVCIASLNGWKPIAGKLAR